VPLVADGLLLSQAAVLRENLRSSEERRSDLAQGELGPPLRPAGPHVRLLLASVLEGALKRSEHLEISESKASGGRLGITHARANQLVGGAIAQRNRGSLGSGPYEVDEGYKEPARPLELGGLAGRA
jgi:hypothetical protein